MIFAPFRYMFAGIIMGMVIVGLSTDYVIVRRTSYEKLKRKAEEK